MSKTDREILITFGEQFSLMREYAKAALLAIKRGKLDEVYFNARMAGSLGKWVLERLRRIEKWHYATAWQEKVR